MLEAIKKYWDLFGGVITGIALTIVAKFKLEKVQLIYSVIILILVSIGILKIFKQTIEKKKNKRRETIIDKASDGHKAIKAIRLAQNPTEEGEEVGKLILIIWRHLKFMLNKVNLFFDKFKGFILSGSLGILAIVEHCGGYINTACQDKLSFNGVNYLVLSLFVLSIVVAIVSNSYSKEQKEKIKALFSKSSTDQLVIAEIKKTIKVDEVKLKNLVKIVSQNELEIGNLNAEFDNATNTYNAKINMKNMTPSLATEEDCIIAQTKVAEIRQKIEAKKSELETNKQSLENLKTTISTLKGQL